MVSVPPGSFMMGSSGAEPEPFTGLAPLHKVTITNPFAIGKYAVTFAEWNACVADGGCNGYTPSNEGWGGGDRPVINVSWNDAKSYADWLSRKTGQHYRLLSEAEFEYAARAGTTTLFWWGDSISPAQANYDGNYSYAGGPKGPYRHKTIPVKSFEPNPWGLYQMLGNVATWTEDCWVDNYKNAPLDGSARTTGNCKYRVTRGGSWYDYPATLRAAVRIIAEPRLRLNTVGFRLARDLCSAGPNSRDAHRDPVPPAGSRS
jgi:formylglycine-generating enzyme required for sulfatase activity